MALMEKYSDLFALANQIGLKNPDVKEDAGKLTIAGQTEYQLDANRLWDNIKTHAGWENEIVANIQAQRSDVFGVHTCRRLATRCQKIAKAYLGDAGALHGDLQRQHRHVCRTRIRSRCGQTLNLPAR